MLHHLTETAAALVPVAHLALVLLKIRRTWHRPCR